MLEVRTFCIFAETNFAKKNMFKLHSLVFRQLLILLEQAVEDKLKKEGGNFKKVFTKEGAIEVKGTYFATSTAMKDNQNKFGNLLKKMVQDRDGRVYSKRVLYDAYTQYEDSQKSNGEKSLWVEALSKEYVLRYLGLLETSWKELLAMSWKDALGKSEEELLKMSREDLQKLSEGDPKYDEYKRQLDYWNGLEGGAEPVERRYYLLSFVSWQGEREERRLKHALMWFEVDPGDERSEKNAKGEVAILKTPSGSVYEGEYKVLGVNKKGKKPDTIQIEVRAEDRPLFILVRKKKAHSFPHFRFLLGNYLLIDEKYENIQGAVLLERLPKDENDVYGQMDIEDLVGKSSLKAYDKLLLYWHLHHLNKTDVVKVSAFKDLRAFRRHMKSFNKWWEWHRRLLNVLFSKGDEHRCFYLYFLGTKNLDGGYQMSLERYSMRLTREGLVEVWPSSRQGNKSDNYVGEYRVERQDAIHFEIRKKTGKDALDYFHLFMKVKKLKVMKGRKSEGSNLYFEGLYGGWRLSDATGLEAFSGRILAVPVEESDWKKRGQSFPLDPPVTVIEEPEWMKEIRSHPAILTYLAGLHDYSVDNGLFFLPGVMNPYQEGALHEDLSSLSGVYYYYRTRTRPGRQYTVKAYAALIDENGFIYVKSSKDSHSLLYRGVLSRVKRTRADTWSAVAVLKKSKDNFGGVLILERPDSEDMDDMNYDMRGLHLSLNYYGDPIAGRVYFVKESNEVDWEKFKSMKSPKYFVENWDETNGALQWHVSEDLDEQYNEKLGDVVKDDLMQDLLNFLKGQINNFLAFRSGELYVRNNNFINAARGTGFYPALLKGNYAEDLLRAAVVYWEENDEKRFRECFLTAILCGGYAHIGNLRKWFVEVDAERREAYKRVFCDLLDEVLNSRGFRQEKQRKRLEYILNEMFGEEI